MPDFLFMYLSSFLTPFISSWSKSRLFLSRRKPPSCCAVRLFSTSSSSSSSSSRSSRPRLDCRLDILEYVEWSLEFVYLALPFFAMYRLCGIDFLFIKRCKTIWATQHPLPSKWAIPRSLMDNPPPNPIPMSTKQGSQNPHHQQVLAVIFMMTLMMTIFSIAVN